MFKGLRKEIIFLFNTYIILVTKLCIYLLFKQEEPSPLKT